MSFLTKLVLLPAILTLVRSEFPFDPHVDLDFDPNALVARSEEDSRFRIPEDFDPVHADIEITPYFDTAPDGKETFTFDGIATQEIIPRRDGITTIVIQDNVRSISSVILRTATGIVLATTFERVREYQLLEITLTGELTFVNGDRYFLTIEYIGNINETPLVRGMFRGTYRGNDGNLHWYAATHLQPTHGRQIYPCFDEPGFKSTYNITVNRPTDFTETFSNMRIMEQIEMGDRVKEIFYRTPRMSAYLITIHISGEFTVLADNGDDDRSYRIIGRPTAQGQGEYALEIGPPLTKWFEDYFGIDYYTMEEGMKNDQLASPFWASGATENWGLVTYRELRLLYEEGETNEVDKMSIGTITAHELAHKWFGNYITARWWNNVWINEGFASYFEYFGMDGVYPELELADQFIIMYVQSALSADASMGTRALQHTVNSPTEVTGHFSGISYSKGASLLLMLKHFLSEPIFKEALHLFLVDRAYEYAVPDDLYRAFASATAGTTLIDNVDITEFMRYWVEEPGYPVVQVDVNTDTGIISLRQERFFLSASTPQTEQVWPLPLTYTTGRNPNWENLTPTRVMQTRTLQINDQAGPEWVIFNIGQKGIYRVNYDTRNWETIANALNTDVSSIHYLNRAQIVDDVFALMRSERLTYELGFKIINFLRQDTSYFSWYPAITGFNWIRNRFLHLPEALAQYDAYLHSLLEAVITDLGYDVVPGEPLTRTLNRFYTLSFACNIGHIGCINDAIQKWQNYTNSGVAVNPNLRRHVFCEGLRAGGYEDWALLRDRRLNSNNQGDEVAMLRSLGCTANERAIVEFINMALSDDVKAQDRVNALSFLYMGNRANARIALPTLRQRINDIRRAVVLPAWFNSVLSNTASYLDEEGLNEMEEWLTSSSNTIPEYQVGLNAIASARANMAWGTNRATEILEAISQWIPVPEQEPEPGPDPGAAASIVPFISLLFTTAVALMLS